MSKTKIEEINRNIYDIKNKDEYEFKIKNDLTPEIIEEIAKQKIGYTSKYLKKILGE